MYFSFIPPASGQRSHREAGQPGGRGPGGQSPSHLPLHQLQTPRGRHAAGTLHPRRESTTHHLTHQALNKQTSLFLKMSENSFKQRAGIQWNQVELINQINKNVTEAH